MVRVRCPSHDAETVRGINESAVHADIEGAVTCVVASRAVRDDEESVPLDSEVRQLAARLERSLGHNRVDAAQVHAEANLGRVGAAAAVLG